VSGPRLDTLDRRILSIIQSAFPVIRRPFDELARRLGADAEEVLARVRRLRQAGVIRRLGAVFDSRALGYISTLAAARVPPARLRDVAQAVNRLPGVTHNYARDHAYNLWFTLTASSTGELRRRLEGLRRDTAVGEIYDLPAQRRYKIGMVLPVGGAVPPAPAGPPGRRPAPRKLDEPQKRLVRLVGGDVPLTAAPFDELAVQWGWPVERLMGQLAAWRSGGVIRRVGAVVAPRRVGFAASGMAVFAVGPEAIDRAGRRLAGRPEVTHCYRRPPMPDFPYELYAMIHGPGAEAVRSLGRRLADEAAAEAHNLLLSAIEFKKASMTYF
jgi:DNA-binding Lrp family transcriptional regulator